MKPYFLSLVFIFLFSLSLFGVSKVNALSTLNLGVEEERTNTTNLANAYRAETFNVSGEVALEVKTTGGNITIVEGTSDQVEVTLYVKRRRSYLKVGDFNENDYEITLSQVGNTIFASVEPKHSGSIRINSISFNFEIKTPANTNTELRTSGGNIHISGLIGKQEARTSGGNITINEMNGPANLRTSGGNIIILQHSGSIDARTSGGNIQMNTISGNAKVTTSGGNIRGRDISGNLEATTSGGSIDIDIATLENTLKLRARGGNITATVPQDIGYTLNLRGSWINTPNMNTITGNISINTSRNRVQGSIGDASRNLDMHTSAGNVNLIFQ